MKPIKYVILLFFVVVQSCMDENVLERSPLDKIPSSQVWNDEILLKAYVTNLYSRLALPAFEHANWHGWTDEATRATGNSSNITRGTVSKSSEGAGYWDYEYIRDLNVFLENIDASSVDPAIRSQLEGEVRFLRAYTYFEKMMRYGGVPLVDVVVDPFKPIDIKYTARATEEAIADFIDTELTTAIGLLTDSPTKGRVNKWTAHALRARAMLWAASIGNYGTVQLDGLVGIPAGKVDAYYTKAIESAEAVINSGNYSLYNEIPDDKSENYRQLFLDEGNSEVIFEKAYEGVNIGHSWDAWHGPNQWATRGGSGDPTLDFILGYENMDGSTDQPVFGPTELYDNGAAPFIKKDPRLFATVFFQGDSWQSGTVETYEGLDPSLVPDPSAVIRNPNTMHEGVRAVGLDSRSLTKDDFSTNSGFHIKKYIDDSGAKIPEGQSKSNWIVFRLAEMYLIKAEAEFELGNLPEAVTALNMTRERAGISLVDESTITLDKIRTERRSEFAFEGDFRYWDLRRWRIAEEVLNKRMKGLQIILHHETGKFYFIPFDAESFQRVYQQEHYYNPITSARIDNNPDLIENPLY